jgi:MvaI/BcnI restriction endonuclease family protein
VLKSSNVDVAATMRLFAAQGIDCAFLVPTATALEKSIIDATESFRAWLAENGVHDYAAQGQGQEQKIVLDTVLFSRGQVVETTTSLYRPTTKAGDPRVWIASLSKFAGPNDLLAICVAGRRLLAVNVTQSDLMGLLSQPKSAFWSIWESDAPQPRTVEKVSLREISEILEAPTAQNVGVPPLIQPTLPFGAEQLGNVVGSSISREALELLAMLKRIGIGGFVTTQRMGDTGVGYTLETLLGIECNSSRAPDYKGVEIKAGRKGSHERGRSTILSQVPDWQISRLKGSRDILRERGRFNSAKGRNQLYHELSALKPNSYGMYLELDGVDFLHQSWTDGATKVKDVTWQFPLLFSRLKSKHGQTFWIKADVRGKGAAEEFHYVNARYTSGVSESKFPMLIEAGVISLDYTIKETPTGAAKDQGYLFKIRQADLPLLFKAPTDFDLTT